MKKKKSWKNTFFWRFLAKIRRKIAKNRLFFTKNAFFSHFFAKKNTRGYTPFFCKICRRPSDHFLTTGIPSRPIFASKAFGAKKKNKKKKKNFIFYLCLKKYFFYTKKKKYFLYERSPWGGGFIEDEAPWTIFPEDCTKRHSELAERSETFH